MEIRLRVNPLNEWSNKEKLCLASAVRVCNDQNWKEISQTMKLLCADNGSSKRPPEWFSQKSCAVQYEQMLELFDAPKHKKRANEDGKGTQLPIEESSIDFLFRQLKDDRMNELKNEIRQGQEEYSKIYAEIKALEYDHLTEEQLYEMEIDVEKEEEAARIEQMKLENQLREQEREREHSRKVEMPSDTWNATDTTSVDMDVEEIVTSTSIGNSLELDAVTNQQQHQGSQSSSLLSSLLKSPTSSITPSFPAGTTSNSASNAAPTITTLLTSGSIPNKNQPTIVLKSTIPPNEAAHLLTRPISGPPTDSLMISANNAQTLLSPSQSAPTLSMLLEKKTVIPQVEVMPMTEIKHSNNTSSTINILNNTDSNKDEFAMDVENDAGTNGTNGISIAKVNTENIGETICKEEEDQLLEVFGTIDNIEELVLDVSAVIDGEGDDFLGGVVDQEELHSNDGASDLESKTDNVIQVVVGEQSETDVQESKTEKSDDHHSTIVTVDDTVRKVETTSSDDSNDNIPLSAVASFESKERSRHDDDTPEKDLLIENVEVVRSNEDVANCNLNSDSNPNDIDEAVTIRCESLESNLHATENEIKNSPAEHDKHIIPLTTSNNHDEKSSEEVQLEIIQEVSPTIKDQTDVKNDIEVLESNEQIVENSIRDISEETIAASAVPSTTVVTDCEVHSPTPQRTISFVDSDDDSSMTDISITTKKEELVMPEDMPPRKHLLEAVVRLHGRKMIVDDFNTSLTIPAKPPALRKLRDRDRDRSESPMIEDEANISITGGDHSSNHRRYSSTPVIDSITNSPTSDLGDFDRETRSARKTLIKIVNTIQKSKNLEIVESINKPKKGEICFRFMDMQTIKKNVESGVIHGVNELQRDIMLMCQNAKMLCNKNSGNYNAIIDFQFECQSIHEFATNPNCSDTTKAIKKTNDKAKEGKSSAAAKGRGSARKSQRII